MDQLRYGMPEMLNSIDVAKALSVPSEDVLIAAAAGEIPQPVWIGSQPRWPRLRLLKWIQNGCPQRLKKDPPVEEHPGDREAEGAIAGMVETYGAPAVEPVTDQFEAMAKAEQGAKAERAEFVERHLQPVPLDLLVVDPSELD